MKKALSLFLATLMLISIFSMSAYAASTPVISAAVATYEGVEIEWSSVAGASGYIIFREDVAGGEPIVVGETTSTSFIDEDVSYNKTYVYAVAVKSANPEVDFGTGAEVTYNHVQLKSVKTDCDAVTLSWVAVTGNVEYAIFRQDDPKKRPACIATTRSASYVDADVEYGVEYKYAIAIREADGGFDVLDFDNPIVVDYSVVDLKVPTCTNNGIVLEWSGVEGASEYLVYRRQGGIANGELIATVSGLSYVDADVAAGTYYAYVIVAKDADYDANEEIDYTTGRLIAYQELKYDVAASTFDGITFSWSAMTNATAYYVYRETVATGEKVLLGTTSTPSYYDKDVVNGVTYCYAVAVQYKNGKLVAADYDNGLVVKYSRPICSRVSNGVHAYYTSDECVIDVYPSIYNTGSKHYVCPICGAHSASYIIPQEAPEAPVITVLSNTSNGVYVKWDKVDGADLYAVYRRGVNEDWEMIRILVGNALYDNDVKSGEYYRYAVKAVRRTDYVASTVKTSGSSKIVSWNELPGSANAYYVYRKDNPTSNFWTTLAFVEDTTPAMGKMSYTDNNPNPDATGYLVRGVVASDLGEGRYLRVVATPKVLSAVNNTTGILFRWNAVEGATGYRVYRKASGDANWTYLKTTTNLFYPDYNVENGVTYTYTVRAVCNGWYSDYVRAGVSIKRLETPELIDIVAGDDGIVVSWETNEAASRYNIYRKTANSGWRLIGTSKGNKSYSYKDTGVVSGVKYTYTVKAVDGSYISNCNTAGISCKAK